MRIAVTHENGEIFQHFGHTEEFKVYEIQDGAVLYSELIGSNGSGHGALAGVMAENAIDVVICGGMGPGAMAALEDHGIQVVSGISGNADAAVAAFLRGELVSEGINCDHHDHDHEEEGGCHCGGGCGSSCGGGCGSGCGGMQLLFEGKNAGKHCKVHYKGTLNDGTQFDSSYDRGEPLEFICAAGMMIPGFDKAVVDMEVGQIIDIHLMPEEAYGPKNPEAILKIAIAELPGSEDLKVGEQVYLSNAYGQPVPVVVVEKDDVNITLDANHEMAGKELNFTIELIEAI